jgi:hypothetical protein
MHVRALVLGLLLAAGSAFANPVDGKWSGSVSTPGGDFQLSFTFKAEGAALTGAMSGMDGMPFKIADGKVDGDSISFSVTIDYNGTPLKLDYKGKVAADQIKLVAEAAGMPFEFVVKKSQ